MPRKTRLNESDIQREVSRGVRSLMDFTKMKTVMNVVESVRTNYSTYSKLELLSRQMMMLKKEAQNILENHQMNLDFSKISCTFKKVPGNYYYIYEKILSILSPNDWSVCPGEFITKLLYDYDYHF